MSRGRALLAGTAFRNTREGAPLSTVSPGCHEISLCQCIQIHITMCISAYVPNVRKMTNFNQCEAT